MESIAVIGMATLFLTWLVRAFARFDRKATASVREANRLK